MNQRTEAERIDAAADPSLLLVVGTMRSGTTLLNRVLHAHPSIGMVYEQTNFLKAGRIALSEYVASWLPKHPQLSKCEPGQFQEWLQSASGQSAEAQKELFYKRLLKQLLPDRRFELIGEKYAGMGRELEELLSFSARCKIIAILRDPRDVFLSNKKRIEQESSANVIHSGAPLLIVDDWAAFCAVLRRIEHLQGASCMTVKYEELVTEFERTSARIFEFLGVPAPREALRLEHDDGRQWSANTSHGDRPSGISAASIGAYGDGLSAAEMLFLQCLLADQMKYHGYKLDGRSMTPEDVAGAYELYLRFGRAISQDQRQYSGFYSMNLGESGNGKWFMEKALPMAGIDAGAFLAGIRFCLGAKGALPLEVNRRELSERGLGILDGLAEDKALASRLDRSEQRLDTLENLLDEGPLMRLGRRLLRGLRRIF